jgi:uncharacterized protein YqeY
MGESLKQRLDQDMKAAMREKAQLKLDTIRMLKSAIKYREIELMKPLDDAGIQGVVASEIKRRRDSIEQYKAGNRQDLADKEQTELELLQAYLPQQLTEGEIRARVEEAVQKAGAKTMKDMGAVMKALMPEVQGRADGKVVSDLVKARLSGK